MPLTNSDIKGTVVTPRLIPATVLLSVLGTIRTTNLLVVPTELLALISMSNLTVEGTRLEPVTQQAKLLFNLLSIREIRFANGLPTFRLPTMAKAFLAFIIVCILSPLLLPNVRPIPGPETQVPTLFPLPVLVSTWFFKLLLPMTMATPLLPPNLVVVSNKAFITAWFKVVEEVSYALRSPRVLVIVLAVLTVQVWNRFLQVNVPTKQSSTHNFLPYLQTALSLPHHRLSRK